MNSEIHVYQDRWCIPTLGRGFTELTAEIHKRMAQSGIHSGTCTLFLEHTSASLLLCENADPSVRQDLETVFARYAPDGDPDYRHVAEGKDDMAAHIRTVLTQNSLVIPIINGRLGLGTWQGVFLWEHRYRAHNRWVSSTIMGCRSNG